MSVYKEESQEDGSCDVVVALEKRVNSGGQASIYVARTGDDSDDYIAVKVFKSTHNADHLAEVLAYRRLSWKCPFILKAWAPLRVDTECDLSNMDSEDPILKDDIGTPRMKKHVFLPVELCQSDVLSQIRKVKCGLGDDVGRKCVGELIEAVSFAQEYGIAHCDLKPENALVGMDGHIRLADWGSSVIREEGATTAPTRTVAGTAMYAAPEVIIQHNPDVNLKPMYSWDAFASDAWSIGIFIYVALVGRPPFHKASLEDPYFVGFLRETHQEDIMLRLVNRIIRANYSKTPEGRKLIDKQKLRRAYKEASSRQYKFSWPETVSYSARDLLRGLLCVDPNKRMTVRQALTHPWIEGEEVSASFHEPHARSISPVEDARSCHSSGRNLVGQSDRDMTTTSSHASCRHSDLDVCPHCELDTVASGISASSSSDLSTPESTKKHCAVAFGPVDSSTAGSPKQPYSPYSPLEVDDGQQRPAEAFEHANGTNLRSQFESTPSIDENTCIKNPVTVSPPQPVKRGKFAYLKSLWSRLRNKR